MADTTICGWVVFVLFLGAGRSVPEDPDKTFADYYHWGKSAYTEERWYECTAFMKRALEDYKYEKSITLFCRKKCNRLMPSWDYNYAPPNSELRYVDRVIRKSLCLQRCRQEKFGPRPNVRTDQEILDELNRLEPYNYLQLCYWKLGDLEHALGAAFTYLTRNPGHPIMSENIQFYRKQENYNPEMLQDLEVEDYQKLYIEAANAYDTQDFVDVIDKIEKGLEAYWQADEDCRLHCESDIQSLHNGAPELYIALAKDYGDVLRCRVNCSLKLNFIRGNYIADFLPSHFHYLQFAYWKNQQTKKACEAVGTYLLFFPEDETMLFNKKFFTDTYKLDDSSFTPRKEVLRYYKRQILELRVVRFIEERFKVEDDVYPSEEETDFQPMSWEVQDMGGWSDVVGDPENLDFDKHHQKTLVHREKPEPFSVPRKGDVGNIHDLADDIAHKLLSSTSGHSAEKLPKSPTQPPHMPGWQPSKERLSKYEKKYGIKVLKKEEELNGSLRLFAEDILSPAQCQQLMSLEKLTQLGNGYSGKTSPHTRYEEFRGLTAPEISQLAAAKKLPLDTAKLFIDKSELARDFVESYFNLTSHLFFDYTHVVCRDAIGVKSADERTDLSHPVHGDNCLLKQGRCVKEYPAYTWRDYSAIIYLNSDFTGGEFIFTDADKNIQAELKPRCGQMVAFSGDTLHGVKAVLSGTRCVLAQWMTLDPKHQETERLQAQQLLAQLEWEKDTGTSDSTKQDHEL